jgi:hypothetical protein
MNSVIHKLGAFNHPEFGRFSPQVENLTRVVNLVAQDHFYHAAEKLVIYLGCIQYPGVVVIV